MKERKQYTREFKEGAVRLVTEQSRTHADVAKSLGISAWSVARWVRAARNEGTDAFRGQGQRTAEEHLATAGRKLGAVNRTHAVALAIRNKIINP